MGDVFHAPPQFYLVPLESHLGPPESHPAPSTFTIFSCLTFCASDRENKNIRLHKILFSHLKVFETPHLHPHASPLCLFFLFGFRSPFSLSLFH